MDRDYFMSPEEAKEFGVIDEVVTSRPPAPDDDDDGGGGGETGDDGS